MFVIKFPDDQHDLSSLGVGAATTAACKSNAQVEAIGSYVIFT
jgi:hypothetical protein